MKVLPDIIYNMNLLVENDNVILNINNDLEINYNKTSQSNDNIALDLIESYGYATALLYLNEFYTLIPKNINVTDFYDDCENLLYMNTKIIEESGIPITSIYGYNIFDSDKGILRGNGPKKILENFGDYKVLTKSQYLNLAKKYGDKINDYDFKFDKGKYWIRTIDYNSLLDSTADIDSKTESESNKESCIMCGTDNLNGCYYVKGKPICDACGKKYNIDEIKEKISEVKTESESSEGTQCSDIATKVDQNFGNSKKKYYDLLLSDITENESNIINRGFIKNAKGQYQRGNYILVKEGNKYLAIDKNKLKEAF